MAEPESADIVHVYPLIGRAHITDDGVNCWCEPEPLPDEPRVLVHHAEQ